MGNVALAATLRDTEERLLPFIKEFGERLKKIYKNKIFLSITLDTSSATIQEIVDHGFQYDVLNSQKEDRLGDNYRNSIKGALSLDTNFIHVCDFDRVLHWVANYPEELEEVIANMDFLGILLPANRGEKIPRSSDWGILFFARTPRAFETHPPIQKLTEKRTNSLASSLTRIEIDIMSGSNAMDRNTTELFLKESYQDGYGIYAEFFSIPFSHKVKINSMQVEGLEWETPDQFKKEIENIGYENWIENFENADQWQKRVSLLEESLKVLKGV